MKITEQKTTEKTWLDEKGTQVPFNRVTKEERNKERAAARLVNAAIKAENSLKEFKELCAKECEKAYRADLAIGKVATRENSKGGYTLYNFDRTIKIERSINESIAFDENMIGAAKEKFDTFLMEGTAGIDDMIRTLISDAFSNTRKGGLDTKKVLSLLGYRARISEKKYPQFHEALDLIEQSIRRPDSKTYYRIWVKDENGQYQNIDLNFSNI